MSQNLNFQRTSAVLVFTLFLGLFASCGQKSESQNLASATEQNVLTEEEIANGWVLLFDGKTFDGWHGLGRDTFPKEHWVVEDGTMKKVSSDEGPKMPDGQPAQGGDIITDATFDNYEFCFDWKISEGGNSGVKYNVSEEISVSQEPKTAALGWEYQVLDDERHSDNLNPTHRAGSLYEMIEATNKTLMPVGEWNTSRIIINGNHGEHWLNGVKVIEYEMDSAEFEALFQKSKYRDIPGFKDKKVGHLVLQDHGNTAWYRNLKVRSLNP